MFSLRPVVPISVPLSHANTELDVGQVHLWVGLGHKILRLGWVALGRVQS